MDRATVHAGKPVGPHDHGNIANRRDARRVADVHEDDTASREVRERPIRAEYERARADAGNRRRDDAARRPERDRMADEGAERRAAQQSIYESAHR